MKKDEFDLSFETTDRQLRVCLMGEIDHHSAAALRRIIDDRFQADKPLQLRLDLSGVSFMDSSGLGLIMGRLSRANENGAELILENPSSPIEKILQLAGMERMVKIERKESNEKSTR